MGFDSRSDELDLRVAALASIAQGALGHMTARQRARGLEQLTARLRFRRVPASPRRVFLAGALAAAAVALVALPVRRLGDGASPAPAPLGYQVEGGTVRFADGTRVELASDARGRLTSVDQHGARFAIEHGAAEVHVTPRPDARWLFDAGPFLITVRGTVFRAAWNEVESQLDLRMEKGLVSVTGPVTGGPIAVRGGQHLTVTLREARVLLRGLDESDAGGAQAQAQVQAPAGTPPAPAPSERPLPGGARAAAARAPAHAGRGGSGWAAALAVGDFDAILAEADREGTRALGSRSSDELAALADAARYRRRDELARQALLAQRRRFPASLPATDAAFLLGRLDEGDGGGGSGGLQRAVAWYDRYLAEAPSGVYASEALGREMVAVQRLHGTARARAIADEYARRFPSGTYAGAARALLAAP
jgi:TolA-binding protein